MRSSRQSSRVSGLKRCGMRRQQKCFAPAVRPGLSLQGVVGRVGSGLSHRSEVGKCGGQGGGRGRLGVKGSANHVRASNPVTPSLTWDSAAL